MEGLTATLEPDCRRDPPSRGQSISLGAVDHTARSRPQVQVLAVRAQHRRHDGQAKERLKAALIYRPSDRSGIPSSPVRSATPLPRSRVEDRSVNPGSHHLRCQSEGHAAFGIYEGRRLHLYTAPTLLVLGGGW